MLGTDVGAANVGATLVINDGREDDLLGISLGTNGGAEDVGAKLAAVGVIVTCSNIEVDLLSSVW